MVWPFAVLLVILSGTAIGVPYSSASSPTTPPQASVSSGSSTATSRNGLVSWDHFSLRINGTRVFLQSGEFHYQRLPVPKLWVVSSRLTYHPYHHLTEQDVFQKLKANGFNTVSIYFFWSYHAAAPGAFDFTSPGKNVQLLLDMAKEAGLWVIARPGPYCNAETNAGGLPLWGSDGSLGKIRTSDDTYRQAWQPWVSAIGKVIAKNEITNGGPVILTQVENELQENKHDAKDTRVVHMQQLEEAFRAAGITVPFTSNEKGMRSQSWSSDYQNVGGAVDIYGLDSYPGSLSCTNPDSGFKVARNYHEWFVKYAGTQPISLPEFEGGWFSAWGSSTFYDQNNIGQRTTFQNIYMAFGGTNWGHSAAPVVYTSYDYSAPIRETRQQTTKLFQTKLVNLFSTSSPDLLKTVMVGNGIGFRASSRDTFTWVLRNPDTEATFTVLQQADTRSRYNITTDVTLETSVGTLSVPDVALYGRQSKILVTEYTVGGSGAASRKDDSTVVHYCTADIATSESFRDVDVLVLYLKEGQIGEFTFRSTKNASKDDGSANFTFTAYGTSHVKSTIRTPMSFPNNTLQAFTYQQNSGVTAVRFSNNVLVYLLDQPTSRRFWAPSNGNSSLSAAKTGRLFILGPYLVRSASVDWGSGFLHVRGDSDVTTTLEAFVGGDGGGEHGSRIHTIDWNGRHIPALRTDYGSYTATVPGGQDRMKDIDLPLLQDSTAKGGVQWHAADSVPEARPEYDDSRWIICNKTSTRSPVPPVTLPVLYSSDYGFYAGAKVYRGRFPSTVKGGGIDQELTAVNITASGGQGFGWTAWLNGRLLGGSFGTAGQATSSMTLSFPDNTLVESGNSEAENVLTVLVDYHGHDETSTRNGLGNPRGLLGASLVYGASSDGNDKHDEDNGARERIASADIDTAPAIAPSSGFTSWKIAGNAGGPANIDPVRGPMNEGGLYAERLGWHLPGFDAAADEAFSSGAGASPLDGIMGRSGVRFYIAHFAFGRNGIGLPAGLDIPLGIELSAPAGTIARVQLWINGYQYGKYVPHIGPQTRFPIPPGILNTGDGETNTLALSLWAMTAAGARLDRVAIFGYDGGVAYETAFFTRDETNKSWETSINDLQPRWTDRSEYA